MACARFDFYTPKASGKAQLLEAKDNLQRMLASIPLTDDERAAVDDGRDALDALIGRLADIPAPSGATPRQIGLPPTATLLPIVDLDPAPDDASLVGHADAGLQPDTRPGDPDSTEASKCSNGRCMAGPTPTCSAAGSSSPSEIDE
jgi:hypothetical protein